MLGLVSTGMDHALGPSPLFVFTKASANKLRVMFMAIINITRTKCGHTFCVTMFKLTPMAVCRVCMSLTPFLLGGKCLLFSPFFHMCLCARLLMGASADVDASVKFSFNMGWVGVADVTGQQESMACVNSSRDSCQRGYCH